MIFINSSPKNTLKIFQPFTPVFIPLGMSYLSAILENNGIDNIIVDEQFEKNSLQTIEDTLHRFERPYIFGFNILTATYRSGIVLAKKLKEKYPDSVIIFGGVHATALPDEVIENDFIDIVVRGEAELIIKDLHNFIINGGNWKSVPGITYKENGKIIHNPSLNCNIEMDNLPRIPYHKFNVKKYDLGYLMTARGCPYKCIFCCNNLTEEKQYRFSSINRVIDELNVLYTEYNTKHVLFLDDSLLVNKNRVFELSEAIRQNKNTSKMTFTFQTRGDHSSPELLQELYSAGFKAVYFGLETASETLMKTIKKGETLEQLKTAIADAKKVGMQVGANFIFGLPGEMHSDRVKAFKLTREVGLDIVKYNNAAPYPGTELYDLAKKEKRLFIKGLYENVNATSVVIESPFHKIPLAYVPHGNTAGEIRFDILHGTFLFYLNWKKVMRFFTYSDLNYSWFDFGQNLIALIKKLPAIIIFLSLITFKFVDFIVKYLYYKLKYKFKENK